MAQEGSPADLLRLFMKIQDRQEALHQKVISAGLAPQLALLRRWQSERLSNTYADLLNNQRFRPACEFFLNDLYAARDFSQRDHDAERLYNVLTRYLPAFMLEFLADCIHLIRLTNRLDGEVLDKLVYELDMRDTITTQQYTQAYRLCNNYAERKYQIELIVKILNEAGEGGRHPLAGVTLRLARGPALRAGWSEMYDFLARGYQALRTMRDIRPFSEIIRRREMAILDKIYTEDPDPFRYG